MKVNAMQNGIRMRMLMCLFLVLILVIPVLAQTLALRNQVLTIGSSGTILPFASSALSLTVIGHEFYDGNGSQVFLRGVGIVH